MGRRKIDENQYARSIRIGLAFPESEEEVIKELDRLTKKYASIYDKKTGKYVARKRSPQVLVIIRSWIDAMQKREREEEAKKNSDKEKAESPTEELQ